MLEGMRRACTHPKTGPIQAGDDADSSFRPHAGPATSIMPITQGSCFTLSQSLCTDPQYLHEMPLPGALSCLTCPPRQLVLQASTHSSASVSRRLMCSQHAHIQFLPVHFKAASAATSSRVCHAHNYCPLVIRDQTANPDTRAGERQAVPTKLPMLTPNRHQALRLAVSQRVVQIPVSQTANRRA